jgi:NAD(P)-dependent dehydrogenase (short-subunit alcohol dehydrogenase family)
MDHSSIPKLFSLAGKVAVVTGSLGLMGKNHCRALAEAGANVVVTDLDQQACDVFASELSIEYSIKSLGLSCDITHKESVVELKDRILERFLKIDALVNNAAINDMFENPAAAAEQSKFENYPLELFQRSLDVNITGLFLCAQVLGNEMAKQGAGSIINIASTYGLVAPDQSLYARADGSQSFYKSAAYPVTKGAVISFTRFLAAYWGHRGVRVNTLSPGGVENHQDPFFVANYAKRTPLGRMAEATDYQGAVIFLASDASSYMTGANLVVDGGWTAW